MDLFPEVFAGNAGMSAMQFCCGMMDNSGGASTQVAELFNPTLTAAAIAAGTVPLVTLTGFIVSVATANADLKILTTATAAVVNTAASAGPQFMDSRRTDTPSATFKMGQAAVPGSGLITTIPLVFNTTPLWIPWNWDLSAGTGLLFSIGGANRAVLTAIWIERAQTN